MVLMSDCIKVERLYTTSFEGLFSAINLGTKQSLDKWLHFHSYNSEKCNNKMLLKGRFPMKYKRQIVLESLMQKFHKINLRGTICKFMEPSIST